MYADFCTSVRHFTSYVTYDVSTRIFGYLLLSFVTSDVQFVNCTNI